MSVFIRYIFLIIALLVHVVSAAQQGQEELIQFSGVVVTSDSLKPVPYTHIIDKSSGFGAVSDYFGYFSFVARKNDTIVFSSMGYKKTEFIIPDTILGKRYTIFQVLATDTIYLSETVIYPWPTKEQFKDAFMNLEFPDDDLEIAMRNLKKSEMKERADAIPMDGSLNYKYYIDKTTSKYYYAGQFQPITILNPFAWAQFIKAWKDGKFKRKNK